MKKIYTLLVCTLFLCSCNDEKKEEKAVLESVTCNEMLELVDDGAVLIDVRTLAEYNAQHLDGAINLPVDNIGDTINNKVTDKETKIVLYCRSGNRSATAGQILIDMGYKNVYDMGGMSSCEE